MNRILGIAALIAALLVAAFVLGLVASGEESRAWWRWLHVRVGVAATVACLLGHWCAFVVLRRLEARVARDGRGSGWSGRFEARARRNSARVAPVILGSVVLIAAAALVGLKAGAEGPGASMVHLGLSSVAIGYHLAASVVVFVAVAGQKALLDAARAEADRRRGPSGIASQEPDTEPSPPPLNAPDPR